MIAATNLLCCLVMYLIVGTQSYVCSEMILRGDMVTSSSQQKVKLLIQSV